MSCDSQSLQVCDKGCIMVLFLEIDHQVVPDQTPEVILSRGSRQVSSLVVCLLALCTIALDAQVGQEGIGEANQMQVCNCRPIGAILVVTEPQQLLQVFYPLLNAPPPIVSLDELRRRERRGVRDEPNALVRAPFAREDHMKGAEGADLEPPGINIAGAGLSMRLRQDERLGAAPTK